MAEKTKILKNKQPKHNSSSGSTSSSSGNSSRNSRDSSSCSSSSGSSSRSSSSMLVQLLEEGSSIKLRSSNGNSNSNWRYFSRSARLTHSQIPGQTSARKSCSCKFRQPVTTKGNGL